MPYPIGEDGRVRGMSLLAVLLASGACDTVFRLDHVGDPPATAGDGPAPDHGGCAGPMHDEDGDGVSDACDLCPGIADDQSDVDHDGVGNACDPSANTQDTIALFISFADPTQMWRTVTGTWTSDGESLTYASVSFNMTAATLYQGTVPDPPFTIEYHYTVDALDALPSIFGVLIDADTTGSGVACGHTRTTNPLRDVVRNTYTTKMLASETEIATVSPGGYRVTATYDRGGLIQCALTSDSMQINGGTQLTWTADKVPAAGALGFRSLQVGASVQYVTIYRQK
jgi:hypothetical protein